MPATARHSSSDPAPAGCEPAGESPLGEWVDRDDLDGTHVGGAGNGVKTRQGNKWFSLIDKVTPGWTLLEGAWAKVRSNAGACGVDGITVEQFSKDSQEPAPAEPST